jgi:hypothetical protein
VFAAYGVAPEAEFHSIAIVAIFNVPPRRLRQCRLEHDDKVLGAGRLPCYVMHTKCSTPYAVINAHPGPFCRVFGHFGHILFSSPSRPMSEALHTVSLGSAPLSPLPHLDAGIEAVFDDVLEELFREVLGMPPLELAEEPNVSAIAAALPVGAPCFACGVGG